MSFTFEALTGLLKLNAQDWNKGLDDGIQSLQVLSMKRSSKGADACKQIGDILGIVLKPFRGIEAAPPAMSPLIDMH